MNANRTADRPPETTRCYSIGYIVAALQISPKLLAELAAHEGIMPFMVLNETPYFDDAAFRKLGDVIAEVRSSARAEQAAADEVAQ